MTNAFVLAESVCGVAPPAAKPSEGNRGRNHDWAGIVTRIQGGENSGIEELYGILNRGVRYYVARQLGRQDLEDRLHEILLVVVAAIQKGQLREPARIMGFVRTVTQRKIAGQIEALIHNRTRENEIAPGLDVVDHRDNPEQLAALKQRIDLMKSVLAQMPERQREILVRFYHDGQTPEQICREMSLTDTQFRLAKSRAKAIFGSKGRQAIRKPSPEQSRQSTKCA